MTNTQHSPDTNEEFDKLRHSTYQPDQSGKSSTSSGPPKQKRWWRRALVLAVVLVLVPMSILLTWNLRNISTASEQLFGSGNVLGFIPTRSLPTDHAGRTNILIIGNAADRDTHGGADLTDTLLLLSLSSDRDDYMLSIPRDLYVDIPGRSMGKINEAFPFGEISSFTHSSYRDGGVGVVEQLVDDIFGLDVHIAMIVNFTAVEEVVDAFNGITVEIDSPDERGLYDPNFQPEEGGPLRLENGTQDIDGQTALRLTRARGAAGGYGFPESDFNRTRNQQAVVKGVLEELDIRWLLNPRNNEALLQAAASHIEMDLAMNHAIPFFRQLRNVSVDDVATYTLRDIDGQNLLSSYRTPTGMSALIPASGIESYQEIRSAIAEIHR